VQGAVRRPGGNPTGTESITQNLGDAEFGGVELEAVLLPIENVTLTANVAYLDAEWDTFQADLNNDGNVTDNSFLDLAGAPEWSAYLAADITQAAFSGNLNWHVDARYTDEYNTWGRDNDPVYYRKEVTLVNASVEFVPGSEAWRASVYARNLTDEEVKAATVAVLFPLTYYQAPREFGVEVQWNF
jgi:iron complex outermembrane receptor protein